MNQNPDPKPNVGSGLERDFAERGSLKANRGKLRLKRRVTEPVLVKDDGAELNNDFWVRFHKHLHTFFGTVLSFVFHVVVLVSLALFVFAKRDGGQIGIVAEITTPTRLESDRPEEKELVVDIQVDTPETDSIIKEQAENNSLTDSDTVLPTISDADSSTSESETPSIENDAPLKPEQNQAVGGGLEGRQTGARSKLAAQNGGSAQSELAVENGLRWLANHQFADGSWRLDFTAGPCDGQCRNPGSRESTTAATGLTIMAFLGAGYTHKSGPYQQQVQAGLDYLMSRMRKSYWGGNLGEGSMYAQAIATIALSEALIMTRDPKLQDVVESAMEYIVTAQHSAGGWRYTPGQPGDTTVTGWQMMALKSCQLAGLDVPGETIQKAKRFLSSVGDESTGQFGYKSKDPDQTSTAIGLLIQMYHGWGREHRGLIEGTQHLVKSGPSQKNVYYNYYATLTLFHARHADWDSWNQKMRDYLIQTQVQKGHESGSWFFQEKYGTVGGRLYTTAMAVMILEVYYRYLPLFDSEPIKIQR